MKYILYLLSIPLLIIFFFLLREHVLSGADIMLIIFNIPIGVMIISSIIVILIRKKYMKNIGDEYSKNYIFIKDDYYLGLIYRLSEKISILAVIFVIAAVLFIIFGGAIYG